MNFPVMRSILIPLVLACLLAGAPALADPPSLEWLVLHYMAADNDLARNALADINEMEAAGVPEGMKILVLLDISRETWQDGVNDLHGARILEITRDDDPVKISSPTLLDLGPVNTGDPALLKKFVEISNQRYPARHRLLSIWNHGSGWKTIPYSTRTEAKPKFHIPLDPLARSIGYDDVSRDSLTLAELASTFEILHRDVLNAPVDVLVFDACLMQMAEVLTAVGPGARYVLGSEEIAPDRGYDHTLLLRQLRTQLPRSPLGMAKKLATAYMDGYSVAEHMVPTAISLVDTARLSPLEDAFRALVKRLDNPQHIAALDMIRQDVRKFQDPDYIDLGHFSQLLRAAFHDQAVHDALDSLDAALGQLVVLNLANSDRFRECRGISLYFPKQGPMAEYSAVEFSRRTGWGDLLTSLQSGHGGRIQLRMDEILDESGDGNLSPGETGRIRLLGTNGGDTDLTATFRMEVTGPAVADETRSERLTLPAGGEKELIFPIAVKAKASLGSSIEFRVYQMTDDGEFIVGRCRTTVVPMHEKKHDILLICEETGDPHRRVSDALEAAGIGFDRWLVCDKGTPGKRLLERYRGGLLIRLLPDSSDRNPFPPEEDQALSQWLSASGRLLLSGQDFAATHGGGELFRRLQIRCASDDGGTNTLQLADGTALTLNGPDSSDNQLFIDTLQGDGCESLAGYLDDGGQAIGNAALFRQGAGYRAVVLGFGLEGVATLEARRAMLVYLLGKLDVTVKDAVSHLKNSPETSPGEATLLARSLEEDLAAGRLDRAEQLLMEYANADERTRAGLEPHRVIISEYVRLRRMNGHHDARLEKLAEMNTAFDAE